MQKKTASKRFRVFKKVCQFRQIQKEIIKKKKENSPLSSDKINSLLKCTPNFLGCYAENELEKLIIQSFPSYLIVNIDSTSYPGSHWISLGLYKDRLEIVDPLGFSIFNWQSVPCGILKFCHRFSANRKIYISKRVQSNSSVLCGFYCIYFILFRQHFSFHNIFKTFSTHCKQNDDILIKQFH